MSWKLTEKRRKRIEDAIKQLQDELQKKDKANVEVCREFGDEIFMAIESNIQ